MNKVDQTSVLYELASYSEPVTIDALCQAFPKARRKTLLTFVGHLLQKKLVANAGARRGSYLITAKGSEFVKAGKRVTSGPNGKLTGPREPRDGTFRDRLWKALRIKRKATVPELIELARKKSDGENIVHNAQAYMRFLKRAGVVVEMRRRAAGHAPTSNGFKLFTLMRDLGPLAPVAHRAFLFDPNSARERIAYQGEAK